MKLEIKRGVLLNYIGPVENGTIIVPPKVRKIGDNAFENSVELEKIILPDSLEEIGKDAFLGCPKLREAVFQKGKKRLRPKPLTIGAYAFANCNALESFDFPAHTGHIGDAAFCKCERLKVLVIPEAAQFPGKKTLVIKDHAFSGCEELQKAVFPSYTESIGGFAFFGCLKLKEVTFHEPQPDSKPMPLYINGCAFLDCVELESFDLPENTVSIDAQAFSRCHKLLRLAPKSHPENGIVLPEGLTTLGDEAFTFCEQAESLHLPSTLDSVGKEVTSYCDRLSKVTWQHEERVYSFMVCGRQLYNFIPVIIFPDKYDKFCTNETSLCMMLQKIRMGFPSAKEYMLSHALQIYNFLTSVRNDLTVANLDMLEALAQGDLVPLVFGNKELTERLPSEAIDGLILMSLGEDGTEPIWTTGALDTLLDNRAAMSKLSNLFMQKLMHCIADRPLPERADPFDHTYGDLLQQLAFPLPSANAPAYVPPPKKEKLPIRFGPCPASNKDRQKVSDTLIRLLKTFSVPEQLTAEEYEMLILSANQREMFELQTFLMEEKRKYAGFEDDTDFMKRFEL